MEHSDSSSRAAKSIAQAPQQKRSYLMKMLHCSAIAATPEIYDDVLTTLSALRETRSKSGFWQEGPWTVRYSRTGIPSSGIPDS
ncbi:hypothetical protein [Xanthomonas oryzae]|uniref:hypothetical protein n=1 Tax=Xanthomonas oryzae TaxID=347 RepID=UPI0015EEB3B8|nr:hypothetical protein [Xanthomonas oryzae]QQD49934.1 hypothetical protein BXO512_001630 [Xanthomonas oryzae pv. oryzae]